MSDILYALRIPVEYLTPSTRLEIVDLRDDCGEIDIQVDEYREEVIFE